MSGPENEETLERFFARVQPTLRSTLARFSIPAGEAEALLKDVLLTLVYKRETIASPERWLLQTVRHRCLTFWRRRRVQLYSHLDSALVNSTKDTTQTSVLCQELDSIVGTLPVHCKGLLRERYRLGGESAGADTADGAELESCVASLGFRLVEQGVIKAPDRDPS